MVPHKFHVGRFVHHESWTNVKQHHLLDGGRIIHCQSMGNSCTAIVCYNEKFGKPDGLPVGDSTQLNVFDEDSVM
jgi:uncharacterized protein YjhX (UPF0386 family)